MATTTPTASPVIGKETTTTAAAAASPRGRIITGSLWVEDTGGKALPPGDSETPLEHVFEYTRFQHNRSYLQWALLLAYFPFGLVLAAVRWVFVMLYFLTYPILPAYSRSKVWFMRIYLPMIGLTWRVVGERREMPRTAGGQVAPIVVANHNVDLDYFCIHAFTPICTLTRVNIVPAAVRERFSVIYIGEGDVQKQVLEHLKRTQAPLFLHPEGGVTNGRTGLLQFRKFVFSLGLTVQPVALRFWRPWPFSMIHADRLGTSLWKNTFWSCFSPFSCWDVIFLDPITILPGETDIAFAARCQTAIADALHIKPTKWAYAHKADLRDRLYKRDHQGC